MEHEQIKFAEAEFEIEDGEVSCFLFLFHVFLQTTAHSIDVNVYLCAKYIQYFGLNRAFLCAILMIFQLSDSNDGYTPLQRPNASRPEVASSLPSSLGTSGITKMDDGSDLEESLDSADSESGSDYEFHNVNRIAKKKPFK